MFEGEEPTYITAEELLYFLQKYDDQLLIWPNWEAYLTDLGLLPDTPITIEQWSEEHG